MADALMIQPDTEFIKDVTASSGGDLKKCFQCATCSAVCDLSTADATFPRKQMILAQWGLKERVLSDPALWLCHHCGDCTTRCPRGARPGDVMSALRQMAIRHFAFPRFMGDLVANPRAFPLLFLLPALLFAAIALWVPKGPATAELEFANVFPVPALEAVYFAVSGFASVAFLVGLVRFLRAIRHGRPGMTFQLPAVTGEILFHERFAQCAGEKAFRWGHLLILWGFLGLAFMGTTVGIGSMAGILRTPLPMGGALKIFANASALVILIGSIILLKERYGSSARRAASTYFDWLFLWTLSAVIFTGILSQFLRLAQIASLMYPVYFVHLVLTMVVLLYAPYSKFAHLAYRTAAIAGTKPWKRARVKPGQSTGEEAQRLIDSYY